MPVIPRTRDRMRILFLGINYWPEETGIGAFTTYRAEYLAAEGHEVTVCTTFPYYPEWKVRATYANKYFATEERNGVRILRSYSYVPAKVTSIKRVLHEASFIALSLMRALVQKRPDVLFVVSPPLGLGLSAILLSRLWSIPYVFDVEDLQPDAAADLGMLPTPILKLMYLIEKMAYRHAAIVSTLTRGMRQRILEKGISPEKVELFEPRADDSLGSLTPEDGRSFREQHGLEDKFIVSHSGNMGVKQGLEVILNAAVHCRSDNSLVFLIVGDGAVRKQIQQKAAALELENLRFMPLLDAQTFRCFLAASDVCLVTQLRSVSDIVFPSKVVTYLAAGRPVIASVSKNSEVGQAVDESKAGIVVVPEDAPALAEAIRLLRSSDLEQHRKNARNYATKRWSTRSVLGHLEQCLLSVCGMSEVRTEEINT